jgi:hypothetical protein
MSVPSLAHLRTITTIFAAMALCAIMVAGVGTAGAKQRRYPSAIEKTFQKSCVKSAKASSGGKLTNQQVSDYCKYTLRCIEARMTLTQFEKNPGGKTVMACEKVGARKALK